MDKQDNVFYKNKNLTENVPNEVCIGINNYFQKPSQLEWFFEFHSIKPHVEHLFKSSKAYFRKNKTKRCWLTFNNNSMKIYCSVCLAFSSESNLFTQGLNVWTHVYQRINEHENSNNHRNCSEAYLIFSNKKNIDFLLLSTQKNKKKEEAKENIQIIERIFDVIK